VALTDGFSSMVSLLVKLVLRLSSLLRPQVSLGMGSEVSLLVRGEEGRSILGVPEDSCEGLDMPAFTDERE